MKLHDPAMFTGNAEDPALVGQKCRACGKVAFPRKRVCPGCFGESLDDHVLSTTGVLHTFTCTHVGAPHLPSPYLLGFVDVPEGVRLLSLLTDCDPWEEVLRVGMPMEMVMRPLMRDASGEDLYTYKFRPAGQKRTNP
ncbi:benzoylsuccinyl-CoA thiolase [Actinomadura sp. LD22]|uniref:Benzoylsuccinyl-CoA thiolase n=1 Tax=Actinomadura physcomitrii TaxID=2650748 RepID=A0A6I4MHX3_9ACTN|nr:OB-fold domain-containing protein [Actinomadura physcomitrii]MWA03271.1 benzoylsuccinyl-CoA thiolase [Actinomadura physcomitrii]